MRRMKLYKFLNSLDLVVVVLLVVVAVVVGAEWGMFMFNKLSGFIFKFSFSEQVGVK